MGITAAYVVVFLIRSIYGGMQILTKVAFSEGMSTSVFVFYRHALASLLLLPVALVLERRTAPPLSYKVSMKLFVHALYGISGSINIYCIGLNYASATSASAIFNLLPVITFVFAVLLRMEFLNLKKFHGFAKVSGVLLCVIGIIVLALYQGPELKSFNHHHLFHHTSIHHAGVGAHPTRFWILGIILMSFSTITWALWTVLQGPMLEEYPSKLLNTTIQILFASIQSFFIALAVERDFSRWKLDLDVGLAAVLYSGIVVSGISYYLQIWVIDKSGPVFLTMSMPLTLLVTVMLSTFLLGEAVSLGSIIGGLVMVVGLYNVLWGQRMEQVAVSKKQEGHVEAKARLDLEEHGTAVPVQATQV